jgi:hypothetical protein
VPRPKDEQGSTPRGRTPQPTLIEPGPATPRVAPKTMIEAPGRQSTETPRVAPPGVGGNPKSASVKTPAPAGSAFQLAGASHSNPAQKWISIGAGAATAVLVLTLVALWLLPRNQAVTTTLQPEPKPPIVAKREPTRELPRSTGTVGTPPPTLVPTEMEPVASSKKIAEPKPEPSAAPVVADTRTEREPAVAEGPATRTDSQGNSNVPKAETPPSNPVVASPTGNAKATRIGLAKNAFDTEKLTLRPVKRYSLTRILKAPEEFADKLVVPTGMFHLSPSPDDNLNGQRKYRAVERRMESRPNPKNPLGLISLSSAELEIEPRVADRLDVMDAKIRADNMSIMTLWFTTDGNPMIVKVDILRDFRLGLKKATYYPEGDIDYLTLRVSPDGEVEAKADDEEWEHPDRMLHFSRVYNARVSVYKKRLQANEQARLSSAMGSLYQGMLRGAAANELQQQMLRRGVGGR